MVGTGFILLLAIYGALDIAIKFLNALAKRQ